MCFSATASFTLSAALVPMGLLCVQKAQQKAPRYQLLAAFPLAFGVQQAIEGLVWVGMGDRNAQLMSLAAIGFILFSHGFWLVWTPLTAACLETDRLRRRVWQALAGIGLLFGAYFNLPIWLDPSRLSVAVQNHALNYELQLLYPTPGLVLLGYTLYVLTILAPMVLSSDRYLMRLGLLILVALLLTARLFSVGFISVWCFFAAVVSLYVGYVLFQDLQTRSPSPLG